MFIILYVNNNLELASEMPMGIYKTAMFQHGIDERPMGIYEF